MSGGFWKTEREFMGLRKLECGWRKGQNVTLIRPVRHPLTHRPLAASDHAKNHKGAIWGPVSCSRTCGEEELVDDLLYLLSHSCS